MSYTGWNSTNTFVNNTNEYLSRNNDNPHEGYVKRWIEIGLQRWADSAERYVYERTNPPYIYNYNESYRSWRYK
ncbi:unnamed protein product [Adineta steineri]|uniref:Uncharacterized protein n=1 Tax=Adineta steineri TaxID=433720 RepID=A0A814KUE0_9BILA|nr:unnamed protein product [Adineta steineri]CAF1218688.1 unnamed protein product [Adineta steineri]